MGRRLRLVYSSSADLRTHLFEHAQQGALLLPLSDPPGDLAQYEPVELEVVVGDELRPMLGEVLQVLPGSGVVVQLTEATAVAELVQNAPLAEPALPPVVVVAEPGPVAGEGGSTPDVERDDEADGADDLRDRAGAEAEDWTTDDEAAPVGWATGGEDDAEGWVTGGLDEDPDGEGWGIDAGDDGAYPADGATVGEDEDAGAPFRRNPAVPAGSSPISWSFEHLQAEWPNLTLAERVRVARFGSRPARMMVLKGLDKTLHVHVINNPGLTADEVAMMASMASLDPHVLRRIATSAEWLRHTTVVRNLVCNPKLDLTLVNKILKYLPRDELSRLTKTGKVRQSIKQAIIKKLDRTR